MYCTFSPEVAARLSLPDLIYINRSFDSLPMKLKYMASFIFEEDDFKPGYLVYYKHRVGGAQHVPIDNEESLILRLRAEDYTHKLSLFRN